MITHKTLIRIFLIEMIRWIGGGCRLDLGSETSDMQFT